MSDFTGDSLGKHEEAYTRLAAAHSDFTSGEVAEALGIERAEAAVALEALVEARRAFVLPGGAYLSDGAARRLRDTALRVVEKFHRKQPFRAAMPTDALKEPLSRAARIRDFHALTLWLIAQGVVVGEPGGVRLPGFAVTPPVDWQPTLDEIEGVYLAAGFDSPTPNSFVFPRHLPVPALFQILTEQGRLVALTEKLYIHRETYERAQEAARSLSSAPGGITVGSLKDALGLTRKTALPLLEKFDATGFTQRREDDSRAVQ